MLENSPSCKCLLALLHLIRQYVFKPMGGLVSKGLSLWKRIPISHLFPCGIVFSMIDSPNIAKTMTLMSMLSLQSTVRPHVASLVTPPPSRSLGLVKLKTCSELWKKACGQHPSSMNRVRGGWDQQQTGVMFPDCCRTFVKPNSLRHHPTGGEAFILIIEIPERIVMGEDRWKCTGNYGKGNKRWGQHSISPNGLV